MSFLRAALATAFALLAFGCGDPLKRVDLVVESRVIGARVEVEGEPERAAPRPGERASARFWVVAPEPDPELGWTLSICLAAEARAGVPSCLEAPFASATAPLPVAGDPVLAFQVPESLALDASTRLAVLGVICPDGSPLGEGAEARCEGSGLETRVSLDFDLAGAEAENPNLNPTFSAGTPSFDGEAWPESALFAEPCAGSGMLETRADAGLRQLGIELPESAREPLPSDNAAELDRESLLVSHFVSLGELERAFSAIPANAEETAFEIEWQVPESAPEGGIPVRFWFVVRDLRGGAALAERSLCLLP